jgi:hypothetical protein
MLPAGVALVVALLVLLVFLLAFMNGPEIIADLITLIAAPRRPRPPTLRDRIAEPICGPTSLAKRSRLR